jgi:hypothetical protein
MHLSRLLAAFVLLLAGATTLRAQEVTPAIPDSVPPGVRVCAGGDVTLGTDLDTAWVRQMTRPRRGPRRALPAPATLLAPLRPLVSDADLVLLNIEGAIGEGAVPPKCSPRSRNCYAMRQPVSAAKALREVAPGAAVVGNVANNHAEDAGADGLAATMRHLADAGVLVTGADTLPTLIVTPDEDTIAVLGFSTSRGPDPRDLDAVRRHVARAAALTPRVVVTMHMGGEGTDAQRTRDTTEIFLGIDRGNAVAFARAAVDAGASLVVGHGPHVMRAAEWRGRALILYSLGNLLTFGPFSVKEPMNRGAIACAVLDATGGVAGAELRSTMQRAPGIVRPDLSARAAVLVDSLGRLDFPHTRAELQPRAAIIRPDTLPRADGTR